MKITAARGPRAPELQAAAELRRAGTRHHDIREHERDPVAVLVEQVERAIAVGGLDNPVAVRAKHAADEPAHGLVVLDEQDRLASAHGLGGVAAPRRPGRPRRLGTGQIHAEGRAGADLARSLDRAAVLLDDPVDRREAEARSLAGALGGEERLEHLRPRLGRHPVPRVGHGDPQARPGLDVQLLGLVGGELDAGRQGDHARART